MKNNLLKKKLGLALGSGGIRGLTHVGVIKTLVKHNIPISYLAGCSIGSLMAAHFALHGDIEKLEDFALSKKREKLKSFFEPTLLGGLIRGEKVEKFLNIWLENKTFADCQIPLCIVTADLIQKREIDFTSGNLAKITRASMAVPGIFAPVKYDKYLLIDGGVCNPVPTNLAKSMGADIVLSVNLDNFQTLEAVTNKINLNQIVYRTSEIMRHYLANLSSQGSDIIIQPNLTKCASWRQYFTSDLGNKIMQVGIKETEKIIPELIEKLS